MEKRSTQGISSYTKEKTACVKYKKRLKCKYVSIYCVVSNELVYDSCLVTVNKSTMVCCACPLIGEEAMSSEKIELERGRETDEGESSLEGSLLNDYC